ncbi:helix-turn-helix domain-containing protein [Pseudoroseicyclus tamaricis]|uniref:Helix-turn-helix transcriptional regulator n=1 Tax=Pseudoroseicyclus tamaricis TaxID=2705421 RepID=A0A6B2JWE5_9RHOB|nr:helix-turn-helix transcriptional regulator [Pseudoroseicyclus tamaricis]NDV02440.1 helix-turn-helix transcriptional regulator [Pseudoroseicyclus tamaricis]
MDVGTAICRKRHEKGLSQVSLAQMSGLSRNYVSLIESNKKKPSLQALSAIAEALETKEADLMGEDPSIVRIRQRILDKYGPANEILEILKEVY